jgi:hypothetical protein
MKVFSIATTYLILAAAASTKPARADIFIVSPGAETSVEGNLDNEAPFDLAQIPLSSARYQQVYASTEFAALSGPAFITQLLFRPDAVFGFAFSSTLPDIQIDLSETHAAPNALSTTYANNVGADDTVVYARGSLSLSSADTGPAGGPKTFDIVINLTTSFLYNPLAGNLLLDVRNFGGGQTTDFDSERAIDGSSRLVDENVAGAAGSADSVALVTEFRLTPAIVATPEPGSWVLLTTVVIAVVAFVKRRTFARS